MGTMVFIDGEQLYLRNLQKSDLQGNYKHWLNDEEVCKYNSHHRFPYSEEQLLEYIESAHRDKSKLVLAIIDKKNDNHVGNISLQSIDYINRTAEIAFVIGEKAYWGKGFAYEAGVLIMNHGFKQLNLNRIYCGTFSNNIGMQKLAAKLGFMQEGIRKQAVYKDGAYLDVYEYGILKSQWTLL